MHSNNVNVNGYFNNPNNTYNVNDNVNFNSSKNAERIAHQLVDKFSAPNSFPFYCKVAYKLSEAQIWNNFERSTTGKNPAGLFNWLCRKDMERA